MNNQQGQVTAEFLFSFVIAFGLFILFFAITYTFSVVEVGQYIAYSVARAQVGSNKDTETQRQVANDKYKALSALPAFKGLFQNGWFVFAKNPEIRQGSEGAKSTFQTELGNPNSENEFFQRSFTGVSIAFQSKILDIKIPFLKPEVNQDDKAGFITNLNAILLRESSQAECYKYWDQRKEALRNIPSGKETKFYNASKYMRMEDNGC